MIDNKKLEAQIELKNKSISIKSNNKEIILNEEEILKLSSIICKYEELKLLKEQNKILKQLQKSKTLEKFLNSVEAEDIYPYLTPILKDYKSEKDDIYRIIAIKITSVEKELKYLKYLNNLSLNNYKYYKKAIEEGATQPNYIKYVKDYEKDNLL